MHDIIPDIHGQAAKLSNLLKHLGWRRTPAGWKNDTPTRQLVFLGDFVDRGPENREVLKTVRSLMDAGKAEAIMGNHELNAIHFHTKAEPSDSTFLRPHTPKNIRQHQSFLTEFPVGSSVTREAVAWMKTLPLFLETEHFRAVHACWDEEMIDALTQEAPQGVLDDGQLARAANKTDTIFNAVEVLAKGPEHPLPEGYSFKDKDGTERHDVRVQWWNSRATSWADIAMSVPHPEELPVTGLPETISRQTYPETAKPVFFGHYWLTGDIQQQAPNALCLDYSAGKDGPLIAYRFEGMGHPIDLKNVMMAE